MFQSQQFSELEEDILECPMYPREDSEQQSEATFNAFQKGIKWLSELSEIVTCPCPQWRTRGKFGIKLQHHLWESSFCKRNFFSSSIQSYILISLGFCEHLESRYVITLEVLCSSEYLRGVLYMKGTSGILRFLKAPVKNWRIHTSLISNGAPPFLVLWKCVTHALDTVTNFLQVRKRRLSELRQFPKVTYLVRERELLWKPTYVKFLAHALCLPGWSKLCFRFLQKLDQNGNRDQEEVELWREYNRRYCRISSERRHI